MKAVKIILVVAVVLLVLLVAAVVVVSLPGVQQAMVTRIVASEPGDSLEMEYFRVGLSGTEARGVDYQQGDASYKVADFSADLSVFDLLAQQELRLGDVVVTGVVIDLSQRQPEEEPEVETSDEAFEGILRQMELPMPLYLDTVRVEGELLMPSTGEAPRRSDFVLTGGGFAPEQEGELNFRGDLQTAGAAEMISGLGIEANVTVRQGGGGQIERARLLAQVSARGAELQQEERLGADVMLLAVDGGEEYEARFGKILINQDTVATDVTEPSEPLDLSTLVFLDATFLQEEGLLTGRWEVALDREQLEAFVEDMELPGFAANGSGEFSYGVATEALDLEGELDLAVDDLGLVAEELRELGGFSLNSRFDLSMDQEAFRLEEVIVSLRDQENANLVEVRNFQPVNYNRQTERLEGVEAGLDLAELTVRGLPVEWANLFLQGEEEASAMSVNGGDLTGQLLVSAEGENILFRLVEPLQAGGISVLSGDEPLVADISFELNASGSFQDGNFRVTVEPWEFFHQQELIAGLTGEFDSGSGRAQANVRADLARLLNQPALQDVNNLANGMLELDLALEMSPGTEIALSGTARDLVTREEGENLPQVVFEAVARETEANVWELDVPLRVEGATTSDLRLAGTFSLGEELNRFALNVSGEQLSVDEISGLAAAFSPPVDVPEEDVPAPPGGRDEEAAWAGFEGTVTVEIAQIQVQPEYGMEDLQGEVNVGGDGVVGSLQATFLDSPVEVDARVRFLAEEERPYVLDGVVEAPQLAAGELFRKLQPQRPPTVEGLFVASVQIEGTGQNLADLADRVRFQARLRSDGGIIRLLYTENPLARLGFAAGSIFGALGRDAAAVNEIAQRLENMPYETLDLQAERDEQLNYILRDFTVLSPEMHLQGRGRVENRPNVPVLEQPMEITLTLAAEGPLERLLSTVNVLGEQEDPLGYRQMRRDFAITGTPAAPDASVFYRILVDGLLRFVVPGDDGNGEGEEEERWLIPQIPQLFDRLMREIGG